MSAKIIETITRPSLDHIFYREWIDGYFDGPKHNFVKPLTTTWVERISFNEIYTRRDELRLDLQIVLFGSRENPVKPDTYDVLVEPNFNPFSLTDTRIYEFKSESDMRLSKRINYTLFDYQNYNSDIRQIENIITFQVFVDEKLVESFEFK
jgi:hypothetical protein